MKTKPFNAYLKKRLTPEEIEEIECEAEQELKKLKQDEKKRNPHRGSSVEDWFEEEGMMSGVKEEDATS